MLNRLIFFIKRKIKYNKFHKKWKFSQNDINSILHKVKYNMPEIFDENLSIKILENSGLKINKSVYIENAKNLNFNYAKNLWLSQKICPFNLIIFFTNKDYILPYKKFLKDAKFFCLSEVSAKLKSSIFNLNINQKKLANFVLKNESEITANKVPFVVKKCKNFMLQSECEVCQNLVSLEQTFLNGNFYFFNNITKNNKKIIILIKKIIKNNKNNYFLIKKVNNKYFLYNFSTKEKINILSNMPIKRVYLSKVKMSASYNINIQITMPQNLNKSTSFFVYIGQENIDLANINIKEKIFYLINNYFNVKINTNNKKINYYFNNYLPQKIILDKINDKFCTRSMCQNLPNNLQNFDEVLSLYKCKKIDAFEAYICIKNLLFSWQKNMLTFKSNLTKNYLLEMFINGMKKSFNISQSTTQKIVVGGVEYINCKSISKNLLEKENQFDVFL